MLQNENWAGSETVYTDFVRKPDGKTGGTDEKSVKQNVSLYMGSMAIIKDIAKT